MSVRRRDRINQRGFTLIEILVVLVIVGLLAALTVANMAGGSRHRELQEHVRELYLLMQTASELAVLNNRELALVLEEDGYQFVAHDDETGEWIATSERLFRPRHFPQWLAVTVYAGSEAPRLPSGEDAGLRPEVVFFSSGETTPFELEFALASDSDTRHRIVSDGLSPLQWDRPGSGGQQ